MKKNSRKTAVLTSVCPLLLLGMAALPAQAMDAGENVVLVGYLHAWTYESSQALKTTLASPSLGAPFGVPASFVSPGTSASIDNVNTAEILFQHFFVDHFAVQIGGGIPAKLDVSGAGVVAPPGPAGLALHINLSEPQNNPLASIRQWTPTLQAKYFYGPKSWKVHPFLGLGVSYTWFTDAKLNQHFEDEINDTLGAALAASAGKPGATTTSARASSSWRPVFNGGFDYAINKHWGVAASATYVPLHTKAEISTFAADGTLLQTSTTQLHIDPLAASFLVEYHFTSWKTPFWK